MCYNTHAVMVESGVHRHVRCLDTGAREGATGSNPVDRTISDCGSTRPCPQRGRVKYPHNAGTTTVTLAHTALHLQQMAQLAGRQAPRGGLRATAGHRWWARLGGPAPATGTAHPGLDTGALRHTGSHGRLGRGGHVRGLPHTGTVAGTARRDRAEGRVGGRGSTPHGPAPAIRRDLEFRQLWVPLPGQHTPGADATAQP